MKKEIWISSGNKGKVAELKLLFSRELPDWQVFSAIDLPHFSSPPENGKTFLENARIKAKALRALKNDCFVLAEDSGLEVLKMDNLPGIHSARYAGPKARDSENVAKLLKMLQIRAISDRSARFFCSMVVLTPQAEEWSFEGEMKGSISKTPVGLLGFGYDPVFVAEGQTQTLAELGPGFKNQVSHRAAAALQFANKLKAL